MSDTLPCNREAEEILINCCILDEDGSVFDEISSIVKPEDFYFTSNELIFDSICRLESKSAPIDELSISEELKKSNDFDTVGGMEAILRVSNKVFTTIQARSSALIVKENSDKRSLVRTCRVAIESVEVGSDAHDTVKIIELGVGKIFKYDKRETSLIENASSFLDKLKSMEDGTYKPQSLATGVEHLDQKLHEGGIGKGEVFIIAAPTSCGKSQLALNVALRSSVTSKKNCLIFSFEMPADQVLKRMIQISSGENIEKALVSTEKKERFVQINETVDKIKNSKLHVINYVRDMLDLRTRARLINRKDTLDLIVIDYLQLIPWNSKLSKCDGISEVSHSIKQMAIELNTPVILLAQINREGARSSKPDIYSLKDSGDIENDADTVLMMYPKKKDMESSKKFDKNGNAFVELDYCLVKNREGERDQKGTFIFNATNGRFF